MVLVLMNRWNKKVTVNLKDRDWTKKGDFFSKKGTLPLIPGPHKAKFWKRKHKIQNICSDLDCMFFFFKTLPYVARWLTVRWNLIENINISLFSLRRISLIFQKKYYFFFCSYFDTLDAYSTKKYKMSHILGDVRFKYSESYRYVD